MGGALINIIVNGAHGRMGQETVKAVQQAPDLTLIAALTHSDNLLEKIKSMKPDVVVDFTTPDSVFKNTKTIIECNVRPVIGTTGLSLAQIEILQKMCSEKKLGGIIAPNFSLGALLMMKMAQMASSYFPDAEIIEYHHTAKKDAPSGTALKTAQLIGTSRKQPRIMVENINAARGISEADVPIHSVRLPGYVASQTVIFGGNQETLTIHHSSTHREAFMPGVLMACRKVMTLHEMIYGLEQLL